MKKKILFLITALAVAFQVVQPINVNAAAREDIRVEILSEAVNAKPVYNGEVDIKVKNNTQKTIERASLYLSVVDLKRKQSFPMDEFGENSYQTREIGNLKPGQEEIVTIPIRVMYVGDFKILANVVSQDSDVSYVSNAMPVVMTSDSHLNKNLVTTVSVITPIALAGVAALLYKKRGRKKK